MSTSKRVDLVLDEVAREMGCSYEAFHRKLLLIGWCHVLDEAERLARIDQWAVTCKSGKRFLGDCAVSQNHLVRAAKSIFGPDLT